MPLDIAIIGAGPSGFYTAEALIKTGLDCRIDIIEGLPTPYGLIRFGVAPDHESTKRVTRAYERTALHERVAYYGNVEVGRDIGMGELRRLYDAVVLAFGASLDRRLNIPGGDKDGVYGSAEFVGWYNGHPDHRDLAPDLTRGPIAVIGNGNVSLDVARVLVKTEAEMARTDLPDFVSRAVQAAAVRDVYLFGRRGPAEAKWTNVELREIPLLADCVPLLDPADIPVQLDNVVTERDRRLKERNLKTTRSFLEVKPEGKAKRLHFVFHANPVEVLGDRRVEALRLERTRVENGRAVGSGEHFEVSCGLVVAAIGYRSQPISGIPFDERRGTVISRQGRVAKGLYVVGWAKRGPVGVIGSNKPDANVVAQHIQDDLAQGRIGSGKAGRAALEECLDERGIRWISFADWKAIESAELAAAGPGVPRKKLSRIRDMLAVLDSTQTKLKA